jgi:hypothetical protein
MIRATIQKTYHATKAAVDRAVTGTIDRCSAAVVEFHP